MDFKELCRREDYIDISGDIGPLMEHWRWVSLVMPEGYGKTTLLSMLYYFFDVDEDSYDIFKGLSVAKTWSDWREYLNRRTVIGMDFNDFTAENMTKALQYMRKKMLNLYQEKFHLIFDKSDHKHANDVETYMRNLTGLERYDPVKDQQPAPEAPFQERRTVFGSRKVSDGRRNLEWSLQGLLRFFHHGEYSRKNPVLLFDNICMLEKTAEEHGYRMEMEEFLRKFLAFEPDKSCCLYMQIWDDQDEWNDFLGDRYFSGDRFFCTDPPFIPHRTGMTWRSEDWVVHYDRDLYHMKIREKKPGDQEAQKKMLLEGKIIMLEKENSRIKADQEHHLKKIQAYRRPLGEKIPVYSENMGLMRLKYPERNEKYKDLNNLVRDLYERSRDCKDYRELYENMQSVHEERNTDWNQEAFTELCERCGNLRNGWKITSLSSDRYWHHMDVGTGEWHPMLSKIKAYVTVEADAVKELFTGAAERLIRDGKTGFTAMVSKVERDGTICFFLSRKDFFLLEKYLKTHEEVLRKGNPFIAHRGMIGISRDLADLDSHNAQQARLLWDYFQMVKDRDEIDIGEMYQLFVLGWNMELSEDSRFTVDFSNSTAQLFVLMMDTFDVLLGKKEVDDHSLLLNDDDKIWRRLADARCWSDVGKKDF